MIRIAATLALALGVTAAAAELKPLDESTYPQLVASHKGRVLVVDFWATWCKPCRAELPRLAQLASRLKAKGVAFVTISADEPEADAAAKSFLNESGAASLPAYVKRARDEDRFIATVDPKWSGALPALMLYDRAGRRVRTFVGETPVAEIEAAIRKFAP